MGTYDGIQQARHHLRRSRSWAGWSTAIGMALCAAAPLTVEAGSFGTDFNSGLPAGTSIFGDAVIEDGLSAGNGALKLTKAVNVQLGAFYLDPLDPGTATQSFTATFQALVGGGSGETGGLPADGFSFNFANDLPASPANGAFALEEGLGTGLTVSFDTYDNGAAFGDPVPPPVIDVKIGGTTIASYQTPISLGMNFIDVVIDLHADGTLDVGYGGTAAFTGLATGYAPITNGQFALAARTGGFNDNHWIDDLSIRTTTAAAAVPEPATLALFALGIAGLGIAARRAGS